MRKFFKNIILFLLIALCIGEIVARLTHVTADIPQRTIDEAGIQKYYPNQEGYWKGGNHKWMINTMGWPGELPESYNNLIVIIGDSFIENFMNPNECHQSSYLKKQMSDFNFLEAGRSGMCLIEALEISKQLDLLDPVKTLIYVNHKDFYGSVKDVIPLNNITQLDLKSQKIINGKIKSPGLKKVLYSWKLLYYFYNRFPLNSNSETEEKSINKVKIKDTIVKKQASVYSLIDYIINNYSLENKVLVFHPNTDESIVNLCAAAGINFILLDSSKDPSWTFDYDSHWTCYGHERVANQVQNQLKSGLIK